MSRFEKSIWKGKSVGLKLFTALVIGCWVSTSVALEPPKGEVLLKISGNIGVSNNGDEAWFDLEMLQALGVTEIRTESPWTEGMAHFKGVRITDVLEAVGAKGRSFEAQALDKYKVDFTGIDYEKYPIIIAWELNGELLTVRTLGPLWVMFPFSDHAEADTLQHRNASIWQLQQLKVN